MASADVEPNEDKVVERIPIYLAKSGEQQYYVLQHPLQSVERARSSQVDSVRVKPKQQKVEMVVSLTNSEENSSTFDCAKAERLGSNSSGANVAVARGQSTSRFQVRFQQRIVSDDRSPQKAAYALVFKLNGALWMAPANVCMMKPRFDGLQLGAVRFGKRAKQEENETRVKSETVEVEKPSESGELRAVVQRIQQQDDRLEALRKLGYDAFKKRCDLEPFTDCRYVETPCADVQDAEARRQLLERVACPVGTRDSAWSDTACDSQNVANCERYVESILRKSTSNASANADANSSCKAGRTSIPELIRTILIRAKVIPFNKLIEYLRSASSQSRNALLDSHAVRSDSHARGDKRDKGSRARASAHSDSHSELPFDTAAILKCLTQFAVLIRGMWVVNSSTLYPDGFKSTRTGVDASILRRGRDFVLFWFTRACSVKRMDVASYARMPAEDLDDVISQVARPNRVGKTERGGWKFIYEADQSFINKYKETVNQQASWWNTRFQILCTELKLKESDVEKIRRTLYEYEKADVENERRRSGSVSPSLSANRRRRHSSCCSSASSVASGAARRRRNTATMSTDDDIDSICGPPGSASPSRRGRKRKADVE